MTKETLPVQRTARYKLSDAARRSADWTLEELWISYLALGGAHPVFDLDGYLSGLLPLPLGEQDVLACALNERLADLSEKVRVPYLTVPDRCKVQQQRTEPANPAIWKPHPASPEVTRPSTQLTTDRAPHTIPSQARQGSVRDHDPDGPTQRQHRPGRPPDRAGATPQPTLARQEPSSRPGSARIRPPRLAARRQRSPS
jgi:hypothetical protein